jgi:hypothetical protein
MNLSLMKKSFRIIHACPKRRRKTRIRPFAHCGSVDRESPHLQDPDKMIKCQQWQLDCEAHILKKAAQSTVSGDQIPCLSCICLAATAKSLKLPDEL